MHSQHVLHQYLKNGVHLTIFQDTSEPREFFPERFFFQF